MFAALAEHVMNSRAETVLPTPCSALTKPIVEGSIMADVAICSIPGCGKRVKARGWCSAHHAKVRKYGDALHVARVPRSYETCVVPGCEKPGDSSRKHYCARHYKRWFRYGDPLGGRGYNARPGEPLEWLRDHVAHTALECLAWPFADRGNGYGAVADEDGKMWGAHRLMCTLAHGQPLSSDQIALHSCGNGHLGCVNPTHLRWGTVSDNGADTVLHGKSKRGVKNGNAKVTADQVRQIRDQYGSLSQNQLARAFGISQCTVWRILHRKAWSWLE